MTTPYPKSMFELLAISIAATVALFALAFDWRVIPGVAAEANLLFAPLLLASVYLLFRWFGMNTTSPVFGIQPLAAWAVVLLVIVLWASSAPPMAKFWIPIVSVVILYVHGRLTRASKNVELQ